MAHAFALARSEGITATELAPLARGIDAGVMKAAHALARRAIEAGHGTDGMSRLTVELETARNRSS